MKWRWPSRNALFEKDARFDSRILALLGVSVTPLAMADMWKILGGSPSRIAVALARLTADGKLVREQFPDGRTRYAVTVDRSLP